MYEVTESKIWVNKVTGQRVSVYSSAPSVNTARRGEWEYVMRGFTVRNTKDGTVGIGRQPWQTREEAEAWIKAYEDRMASYKNA